MCDSEVAALITFSMPFCMFMISSPLDSTGSSSSSCSTETRRQSKASEEKQEKKEQKRRRRGGGEGGSDCRGQCWVGVGKLRAIFFDQFFLQ